MTREQRLTFCLRLRHHRTGLRSGVPVVPEVPGTVAPATSTAGPMGLSGCVFGTIAFEIEPVAENATNLKLSHRMMGEIDDESIAMYRAGWKALIEERLCRYIATGADAWSVA